MQITNGQKVSASFDIYDAKGKVIPAPAGTTFTVTGGDTGGATGVAQWVPDASPENGRGTITTDGDNLGSITLSGAATLPDGTAFSGDLPVEVIGGPPSSGAFTVGTPVNE
jgi:hypothetical protein